MGNGRIHCCACARVWCAYASSIQLRLIAIRKEDVA
jgi:hypothetical protein